VNVLVGRNGIAKLCDFGVAKSEMQRVLTRVGVVKGKFRYMAPEQANAEVVDRRADVFSLGAVLWEALVGRRLFDQASDDDVVAAIRAGDYPAPGQWRRGIPGAVDRVVRRALAPDRDGRYQTARDLHLACEELLRLLPQKSSTGLVGEYVSAELDGTAGLGLPTRRAQSLESDAAVLTAGFEVLDPPVPLGPTQITVAPDASGLEGESQSRAHQPSFWGRLVSVGLMVPATAFWLVGRPLEWLCAFLPPSHRLKEDPLGVRLTRTSTRPSTR
jgi:serine/threonine protein kinase